MKYNKIRILLIYFLLFAVCFSACKNSYLPDENTTHAVQSGITPTPDSIQENTPADASGNIVMGIYDFDTLNPLKTESEALRKYLTLVYDSPVVLSKDASPTACLVQEWSTSDGGKTWYFKMNKNIKFHDGSECTVYDIKNTIEWIQKNGGSYAECAVGVNSFNIISVYEIEIVLNEKDAFFPCKMIFPVVKSDDLEGVFSKPNGTGRYKYVSESSASDEAAKIFSFALNETYYGEFPKIATFEIRDYEDAQELYDSKSDIMMFFDDNVIKYAKKENYAVCSYSDNILSCMLSSSNADVGVRHFVNNHLDKRLLILGTVAGFGTEQLVPFAQGTYYLKELNV